MLCWREIDKVLHEKLKTLEFLCLNFIIKKKLSLPKGRRKQGKPGALKGKLRCSQRYFAHSRLSVSWRLDCEVLRCTGSLADVPRT